MSFCTFNNINFIKLITLSTVNPPRYTADTRLLNYIGPFRNVTQKFRAIVKIVIIPQLGHDKGSNFNLKWKHLDSDSFWTQRMSDLSFHLTTIYLISFFRVLHINMACITFFTALKDNLCNYYCLVCVPKQYKGVLSSTMRLFQHIYIKWHYHELID